MIAVKIWSRNNTQPILEALHISHSGLPAREYENPAEILRGDIAKRMNKSQENIERYQQQEQRSPGSNKNERMLEKNCSRIQQTW
eukprot:snap_masked-scaffold_65-processed-gene-0.46-mRNA-1 protein AED:1.00 eAED:1.00 QI:0/0/0/0/1/1/2/0/84